jgi:hypothetical protein
MFQRLIFIWSSSRIAIFLAVEEWSSVEYKQKDAIIFAMKCSTHLEDQRSALRLLVTTVILSANVSIFVAETPYPSSKCLHRFSDS